MYHSTYININMNCVLLTMLIPVTADQYDKHMFISKLYHPDLCNKSENKPAFFWLVPFLIPVVFLVKYFIKTYKTSC
jgi:hypothetical protein